MLHASRLWIVFASWFFLVYSCQAEELRLPQPALVSLVSIAEYLEDPSNQLSFEQIQKPEQRKQFKLLEEKDMNRGITRSAFWLKFQVVNKSDKPLEWVLFPETSYLDNLEIYSRINGGSWRHKSLSDYQPFSHRDQQYRRLNASFSLKPQEKMELLVKLSTNTLETVNIQLFAAEMEQFREKILKEYLYYGIYYGLFIALAFLTVSLWAYSQNQYSTQYQLYFLTYLLFTMLMWTNLNGFSFQFFWANHPWLFNQGFHVNYLLVAIFSFLFSRQLLNTKVMTPRADKLMLGLVGIYTLAIGLRLLGNYDLVLYIAFFALLSMTIQPIIGWRCYKKGNSYVLLYILAWLPYSVLLILSLLSASSTWSYYGMGSLQLTQLSVLFECVMLILATLGKMKTRTDQLTKLSRQDPLTQLGNRRQLEEHVGNLRRETERDGEYWVLLIDIDHFKKINDNHGHSVGDAVLVNLAQILKRECRSVDLAIRWGGEEFILLINVTDEVTAHRIAERIRKTFNDLPSNVGNQHVSHTLSIGLHKLDFAIHNTLSAGVEQADKALYRAKSTGRNKVISYTEELEILQL